MDTKLLDSLTPSERTILRVLLTERDQKTVARHLGLSPETVKSHLRNAREKCRADTSFGLAKALALHERHPPEWGMTPEGGEPIGGGDGMDVEPARTEADDGRHDEAREMRQPFVFDHQLLPTASTTRSEGDSDGTTLRRLLAIAAIVLLLMLLIILAFPLSESFQRLANLIEPPTG